MIKKFIQSLVRKLRRGDEPPAKDNLGKPVHAPTGRRKAHKPHPHEPKVVPVAQHRIDPHLVSHHAVRVVEDLQKAGFKAFIVGGAVRDLLLGVKPKDFDVATNAEPEQVQRAFRRARIIGRRFRLVHVMFGPEVIEVSTFRAIHSDDVETDEHGRVLRDNVFGEQHEDAARRDFTVNALYYDPVTQTVLDYHDGVADLKARRLRIIGDPVKRFREDPVRMLRAVRFAAKLDVAIDPKTAAPIRELAGLIENVPAARLFDEMLKLLTSGSALACLEQLRGQGLHKGLLPLLDVVLDQPGGNKFVELALAATDHRIRAGKPVSPGFLFASLLWNLVRNRWEKRQERGEHTIPALNGAIDDVMNVQGEKLAIQRRYVADMREIWLLQPRFDRRRGSAPYRLLEQMRLRAGMDFLLLRCEAGELPMAFGQWWKQFIEGDAASRERLMHEASRDDLGEAAASARKRKRKPKRPQDDGAASEPHSGSNVPPVAPSRGSQVANDGSDDESDPGDDSDLDSSGASDSPDAPRKRRRRRRSRPRSDS